MCNNESAATVNVPFMLTTRGFYFGEQQNPATTTNTSWWLVNLVDIDVARGEARVAAPVSSDCSKNETYHEVSYFSLNLNGSGFLFSSTRNAVVGVGQSVVPLLMGKMISGQNYSAACRSLFDAPAAAARDGTCAGLGCCESAELAPGLGLISVGMYQQGNSMWKTFPCTYAMAVDKSWYNFSLQDLYGYDVLGTKFSDGVPVVLDFAVRNDSCPADGKTLPMACRSDNSRCVNATYGPGYLCKCKDGFDGNPYLPDGCQGTSLYHTYASYPDWIKGSVRTCFYRLLYCTSSDHFSTSADHKH
jgi:hypothetical protein